MHCTVKTGLWIESWPEIDWDYVRVFQPIVNIARGGSAYEHGSDMTFNVVFRRRLERRENTVTVIRPDVAGLTVKVTARNDKSFCSI